VFVDSPLAIKLTAVYKKYSQDPMYFDEEAIKNAHAGMEFFDFPRLRFTLTTEQSKSINEAPMPKIIIAGSGMSNGGRILHHELRYLPDPNTTILMIGYQAKGTLGRAILDGASMVRIMGEEIPVRCRVATISGYSAHADQPLLLRWLFPMRQSLKKVFIVHGDMDQMEPFAQKVRDEFALNAVIPTHGMKVTLE
jgi:metallo-beta-lactamase family protein